MNENIQDISLNNTLPTHIEIHKELIKSWIALNIKNKLPTEKSEIEKLYINLTAELYSTTDNFQNLKDIAIKLTNMYFGLYPIPSFFNRCATTYYHFQRVKKCVNEYTLVKSELPSGYYMFDGCAVDLEKHTFPIKKQSVTRVAKWKKIRYEKKLLGGPCVRYKFPERDALRITCLITATYNRYFNLYVTVCALSEKLS